jgi:Na+-transporting methylmalonyl-CoA/oxaloacetate decarboxylase gamma subunit
LLGLTAAEKWSTGGMTTLMGLGTTFIVLILLILFIRLLEFFMNGSAAKIFKKKSKTAASEQANAVSEQTTSAPAPAVDGETMKIVAQSVQTYVKQTANDGKPHDKVKIISVKEVCAK